MKPDLLDALRDRVFLSDGGMGTELQLVGLDPGGCGELWNLEYPEKVKAIHRAFLDAGAELLTTNSFRANGFSLSLYDEEGRVRLLNKRAAELAREVAGDKAWVLGSMGPFGGFLQPLGETPVRAVFDSFVEQAEALLEGGADAIVIETMVSIEEAELAIRAAREAGAPVIMITMAFSKVRDGYRTMMGVSPHEAAQSFVKIGADVIGSNCGTDLNMGDHAEIVRQFRTATEKPILVQPNAGQPELEGTHTIYRRAPGVIAQAVPDLVVAGANIIGGCCGTTPEHIRLFADRIFPQGAAR